MPAVTKAPVTSRPTTSTAASSAVVAHRQRDPAPDLAPDEEAQAHDVGVGAEHRDGARRRERGFAGDEVGQVTQGAADAGGRGATPVDRRLVEPGEPAPEQLRHEMVLRGEVVVGSGRGDAGPPGDVAHRQPVVAVLPELVERSEHDRHGPSPACLGVSCWRVAAVGSWVVA